MEKDSVTEHEEKTVPIAADETGEFFRGEIDAKYFRSSLQSFDGQEGSFRGSHQNSLV